MSKIDAVVPPTSTAGDEPMIFSAEAYVSRNYAKAEREKLWAKTWQIACREEDIPEVGNFCTYEIADESLIVTRTEADAIVAYHNVCPHRGRRLTAGCGHANKFYCRYHGWQWDIDGKNIYVRDREEWKGELTDDYLRLGQAKVGRWAGYVFVNFDRDCQPFEEYLGTLPYWLDPFELGKMRYKWRQWLKFPCNWKVAIEAFIESYHVAATHPQLLRWGDVGSWSRAEGLHSCMGTGASRAEDRAGMGTVGIAGRADMDARTGLAGFMHELNNTVGLGACTTDTFVAAADQLVEVLHEGASAMDAAAKMLELAEQMDAERGVEWPKIDPQHSAWSGIDWHVFPNSIILHGVTFILGYRARPDGDNPDSCIFEAYVLERFPEGQEPKTENVYEPDVSEAKWQLVLMQDFHNMPEIQKGMKSKAFKGAIPTPLQEQSVINLHRNLAKFMGGSAPRPFHAADYKNEDKTV